MPGPKVELNMGDAIAAGRSLYQAKEHKKALEQFTMAMKLCSCTRGMKRERCACKDYETVASQGGCIFKEAMYNCSCAVGKTFSKCDNDLHLQALDYRAAAFEALGALDRARRDAEWILELAPRRPDGYLRLGKIARLQKKREYAWKLYDAGIQVNKGNTFSSSKKLQQLYEARQPLHRYFARRDPMSLPPEIVQLIMSYLEFVELPVCLAVSKSWRRILSGPWCEPLWRDMLFPDRPVKRAPNVDVFKRLLALAGRRGARKVIIRNPKAMFLNTVKLSSLLRRSIDLEHLEIGRQFEALAFPERPAQWKRLQYVAVDGSAVTPPWSGLGRFPAEFLNNSAESLQHLCVTGVPGEWYMGGPLPSLPCLRSLRLNVGEANHSTFPIFTLADAFPGLEQLYIGCGSVSLGYGALQAQQESWTSLWPQLMVLMYDGPHITAVRPNVVETLTALRLILSLNHGGGIRHIGLDIPCENRGPHGRAYVFGEPSDVPGLEPAPQSDFTSLQSLRLGGFVVSPADAHRAFSLPLLQTQSMSAIDIVFPAESLEGRAGEPSLSHLRGYSWLRGAEAIRSMGCYGFRFRSLPRNDDDLPLPAFLATFPNLEILALDSAHYDATEFVSVIAAILKVATNIKTVYTVTAKGAPLDQLRAAASAQGIAIVSGRQPKEFPVALNAS